MEYSNRGFFTIRRIYLVIIVVLLALLLGERYRSRRYVHLPSGRWDKLYLVLDQIEKNYVDPINAGKIVEDALPAILGALDPHSVYLPPVELKEADEALEGNFDGIGVYFNVTNDTVVVSSVVTGGPSERAGVQAGDRIIAVNEQTVAGVGMAQDSIVRLLRGPRGTNVTIQVQRYGLKELVAIAIVRDKIPDKSVTVAYMVDDQTGYILLSKFNRTSYEEVLNALAELTSQGMKRLIFDLRGNSGGYMEPALRIAGEFLDKGTLIVYQEGARRPRQNHFARTQGLASDIPLAILINEASASSSEILAGALQDNDRATIVGRRSYGKGLVQEPIYFSDYSGIRLTVGRYYTPTGRCLQRPYDQGRDSYRYDIWERYRHGELTSYDSIPKNDSLKYLTPQGKVVYGGGGIIPDVFVPMDTTRLNSFFAQANRKNLMIRFSHGLADRNRTELQRITNMQDLEAFYRRLNLSALFLDYAAGQGLRPKTGEWEESEHYILSLIRAYIGRNTPMEEQAFYFFYGALDPELQVAKNLDF
ncbi:MAG: S41 family peptidase [Bacteroidales bacterium]|nr:S41 family peptidase [Bacteroidales bacterium]